MATGSGNFADNAELRKGLREDFDPAQIVQLDKGFGPIDTLNHAVVTDRLNNVAPGWTYELDRVVEVHGRLEQIEQPGRRPKSVFVLDPEGLPHVVALAGWMQIGTVRRYEVGEVENFTSYGDEFKKALSDFIKRGAMRFGVGIALWAKGDLPAYETTATNGGVVTVSEHDGFGEEPSGSVPAAAADQPAEEGPSPQPSFITSESVVGDAQALLDEAARPPDPPSPPADIDPVEANVASDLQWERLRAVVGGSEQRAVNRLNSTNSTNYTKATAPYATKQEVENAITGEKP